ncbi:MAG: ABC transporter substrate-binding protein [Candidatus Kapabacteria bacterium]|nr:ABC transporter substrate-binding protein [Candidatus Kapabacteria bacterium]MBP7093990.1 ABC transporter substrate-binding protein [Candidatus Kapabacteria bacterium]
MDSALHVAPCIARSWSVDLSGVEWTFTIRNDVWFHPDPCFGQKRTRRVVAQDVKYSLERICDARTKSTGLWAFRTTILGADEFHQATRAGKSGSIQGIFVENDSVLKIRLTKPFAPFLAVLTMPYGSIIPREAIEAYGADHGRHPVGTGPFMFGTWNQDRELTLTRNPRYFKTDSVGRRLPYLETIRISFLRDPKNEFLEFSRGQFDLVSNVDESFVSTVFEPNGTLRPPYDRFRVLKRAANTVEYYGILMDTSLSVGRTSPLVRNRFLRQALNYAIDRHRIVTYLLNGRGQPALNGVLPPSMPGFSSSVKGYRYDPDEARRLLALAGYPNGKGLPTLLLQLGNSQRTASIAEAIQAQWKEIGVNVELRQVDFPQHLSMVRAGDLALWRTSWIGDYPDPENFLALFIHANIAPNGPNTTRIDRRDLDSLYAAALSPRLSFDERAALYQRMEQIVVEEAPWIFLYYHVVLRVFNPNVKGLTLDGSDRLLLERVFKDG